MITKRLSKLIALLLSFLLLIEQSGFAAGGAIDLSSSFAKLSSGISTSLSSSATNTVFRPIHLRYLEYLPKDNSFKLLLDKGDSQKEAVTRHSRESGNPGSSNSTNPNNSLTQATQDLMKYFYIGLTLPNDSFWVNLRPDSPDNIIDTYLSKTDIGRILLEADVQLKKDTASYTNPSTPEGKEYWNKLYKKAEELFGTDQITIPTLTRPWIVPGEIIIRETQATGDKTQATPSAYIYKATLKVMLEEDYLKFTPGQQSLVSSPYQFTDPRLKELNHYSTELIKELIIPKLTKEVNSSRRYASLRQVYYSLILAQWFKTRFQGSFPRTRESSSPTNAWMPPRESGDSAGMTAKESAPLIALIDSKNLTNLTSTQPWNKSTYFNQYQQSFTKGEYNTKETVYTPSGQVIRSYMSGGVALQQITISAIQSNLGTIPRTPFTEEFSATFTNDPSNLNISVSSAIDSSCWQGSYEEALKKMRSNPLGKDLGRLFVHPDEIEDIAKLFDIIGINNGDTVVDIGPNYKYQIAGLAALKAGRVIVVDPMFKYKNSFKSDFQLFTEIMALSLNISPQAFGRLFIESIPIESSNLDEIKPAKVVFLLNLLDFPEASESVQSICESVMKIVQEGSSIIFTVDREDNGTETLFASAAKKGFRLVERESYEYLVYGATRFEVVRANVVDSQPASSAVENGKSQEQNHSPSATGHEPKVASSAAEKIGYKSSREELNEKEIAEAKKFIAQLSGGTLFLPDITEEWRLQGISGRYLKVLEAEKQILHDKLNKKGEGAFLRYGDRYLEISNSIFFLQLYFRGILLSSRDPAYVRASEILQKLLEINGIEGKYYLLVPKSLPYLGYLYTMAQNVYLMISEDLISSLDDDGLAWVIAHELVHCEKGHSKIGLRAMALYGDHSQENRDFWSNFQQSQEKEADSIGFDYVVKAGYKRESCIKALETLGRLDIEAGAFIKSIVGEKVVEPSDKIPLRAQTHPSIEERVAALRRKISSGSPATGDTNGRASSSIEGEIKLSPALVEYIQSLPREKIMREMAFLEVLDKLLKGMAGYNVYERINYAEALRSLIDSGLITTEDLEAGVPLGHFVYELETVSGNLLSRYSELITFFINMGFVKDEELVEARQRIELDKFVIKKPQKTKKQKQIKESKLSPEDLINGINSATILESIQINKNVEVLSALYSSGLFTREEIRGDILPTLRNMFLNNKVTTLNNKYSFGSYAYYSIRLISLLREDERLLENLDKYIISSLVELSGGISIEARELFYNRLAQLIKEGCAPDEARSVLQRELLEFYVTQSQKAEIISEIKKIGVYVGRLVADIFKINGSLSINLKKVFRLFKMELKDNGNAETAAAQIMENCLNNVPVFAPKSLTNFPKENKSFRPEVIPVNELEKLLSGAKFCKRLGRTLVYQTRDRRYLALKFQKRSVVYSIDGTRQENEEAASKLLYESEIFDYLHSLRQQGVLIGDYPQAQLLAGKRVVSLRESDLPQDMIDILNEPSQSSVNLNEEICIDRKNGYVTATGYITENLDYFTYLHEAKNDAVFKQAARKNIHDLFVLAKYGIIHPDIVELFHDARVGRNYLVLVDLITSLGIDDVRGAGCLDAWKRYVSYPNMRISGPADFAELVRLEDLIDLDHKHSEYLRIDLQRFSREQRTNLILAHFLGNYFLALALIEGRRLETSGRLDWKNPGRLAASMRNSFSLAYEVLTGRNDDDVYKLVNWSKLAKQMALFMSGDYRYLDSVVQKKMFKVIFGLSDLMIEPGRGWGYIHQDLIVDKLRSSVGDIKDEAISAILDKYFMNDRKREPGFEKTFIFKEEFLALIQEDKINPELSPQGQKIINVLEDLYNTYSRGWRENGKDDYLGPSNGPFPLQELVNAIYTFTTVMIGRTAVGPSLAENTKTAAASSAVENKARIKFIEGNSFKDAAEFLNNLGIWSGAAITDVGTQTPYTGFAAVYLGAKYTGFDLDPVRAAFNRQDFAMFAKGNFPGQAKEIKGEFSNGEQSKSQVIPDHSQDFVLVLTGALSDPVPESDAREVLEEALRVIKPGGKIVAGTYGVWKGFEQNKFARLMREVLANEKYKGRIELKEIRNIQYDVRSATIYEVVFVKGGIDGSASSSLIFQRGKAPGGIDFRALPIVTQAVSNLGMTTITYDLRVKLSRLDMDAELAQINKLIASGITPSTERIKEFAQAAYLFRQSPEENAKILSCIAQVLRKEEDECYSTDPILKDVLIVLEAGSG